MEDAVAFAALAQGRLLHPRDPPLSARGGRPFARHGGCCLAIGARRPGRLEAAYAGSVSHPLESTLPCSRPHGYDFRYHVARSSVRLHAGSGQAATTPSRVTGRQVATRQHGDGWLPASTSAPGPRLSHPALAAPRATAVSALACPPLAVGTSVGARACRFRQRPWRI